MNSKDQYIPALGRRSLTWAYDLAIALMTREAVWRSLLVAAIAPQPGDVILDVGCGTGSLAILLKRRCPQARVIGVDPDPEVLGIARRKARNARLAIELAQVDAGGIAGVVRSGEASKVASSLVFHHLSLTEKRVAFQAILDVLKPGGGLSTSTALRRRNRTETASCRS
jgi:FkbM family methyltransferase